MHGLLTAVQHASSVASSQAVSNLAEAPLTEHYAQRSPSLPAACRSCSVLTPYRHYFRALTGSLVAYLLYSQGVNRRTLTTLALCAGLMVSQDVLSAYNKGELREGLQQLLERTKAQLHLQRGATGAQQQQPAASRTRMHVKGMRCEGW